MDWDDIEELACRKRLAEDRRDPSDTACPGGGLP